MKSRHVVKYTTYQTGFNQDDQSIIEPSFGTQFSYDKRAVRGISRNNHRHTFNV